MSYKSTHRLTLAAIITAMSVLFLVTSSVVPIGYGILFILGSAMICMIVCECGTRYALIGFAAALMLTAMLSVDKTVPALFGIFSGWYPIAKLYIDRLRRRRLELLIKCCIAAAVAAVSCVGARLFGIPFEWYWVIACAAAVIGYDYILSQMIWIYYNKIRKHIMRGKF